MKGCRMKDGRVLMFDPVAQREGRSAPDWANRRKNARQFDETTHAHQIIRYLYLDQGFEMKDIAEMAGTDEDAVHRVFLRWKKYLDGMENLAKALGTPYEILLMHARAFTEKAPSDLPVPVPFLDDQGNETEEMGYMGLSFLKSRVPSLATTFLFRSGQDLALVSRAEKDMRFREGGLFLIRGMDDALALRRGVISAGERLYELPGFSPVLADCPDRNLGQAVGFIGQAV